MEGGDERHELGFLMVPGFWNWLKVVLEIVFLISDFALAPSLPFVGASLRCKPLAWNPRRIARLATWTLASAEAVQVGGNSATRYGLRFFPLCSPPTHNPHTHTSPSALAPRLTRSGHSRLSSTPRRPSLRSLAFATRPPPPPHSLNTSPTTNTITRSPHLRYDRSMQPPAATSATAGASLALQATPTAESSLRTVGFKSA